MPDSARVIPRYPARTTPLGELAVWLLVRAAMRRMFARVRLKVAGDDPRAAELPLLAIANHPSWWDGYLALVLSRHFGLRRYLMMDAAQLRRYGFFAWAGCFGVDRADSHDVSRSVAYAAHLLAQNDRTVLWMFPQGEIVPPTVRPLALHAGSAHVVRRATSETAAVGVMPVAWQLVFRGEQHPDVVIRTGAIQRFDATSARDIRRMTTRFRDALEGTLDALQSDINAGDFAAYRTILDGRRGINDLFDRLMRRDPLAPDP